MAKSKLDAYKDLLGDMTDEKLVELTGYKLVTVQKYRAKAEAELKAAIDEVAELTGTDPKELEEAPSEEAAELDKAARESGYSEEGMRDVLAGLLESTGVPVTEENILRLADTSGAEEALAVAQAMKADIDAHVRRIAEPEVERIPHSFSTTRTINVPGPRGRVFKIGKSIFRGERAASVWRQLSDEDRKKNTAGICWEKPKG